MAVSCLILCSIFVAGSLHDIGQALGSNGQDATACRAMMACHAMANAEAFAKWPMSCNCFQLRERTRTSDIYIYIYIYIYYIQKTEH